jgi:Plasma-membrane choline transporter
MVYHLGSVAIGSLLMAVVQFIRWLLNFADRRTKGLQEHSGNQWLLCLVRAMRWMMWIIETVLKFVNKCVLGRLHGFAFDSPREHTARVLTTFSMQCGRSAANMKQCVHEFGVRPCSCALWHKPQMAV